MKCYAGNPQPLKDAVEHFTSDLPFISKFIRVNYFCVESLQNLVLQLSPRYNFLVNIAVFNDSANLSYCNERSWLLLH